MTLDGFILPPAKLLAKNNIQVNKASEVRYKGCFKVGENQFGCLNLYNNKHQYPEEVSKCLKQIANKSNVEIKTNFYYY